MGQMTYFSLVVVVIIIIITTILVKTVSFNELFIYKTDDEQHLEQGHH